MPPHAADRHRLTRSIRLFALFLLVAACSVQVSLGDDWPRWRGPQLNGISSEKGWRQSWSGDKPEVAWRASVGAGYSSFTISAGRLYTIGNADDQDTVYCLDAQTGETLWKHRYESPLDDEFFDGGPTSTPTVDGNRLFVLSRPGDLFCFDAASGKVIWSFNVAVRTNTRVPRWGFAGSPLVHGDLLLLNVGEAGLALDKTTGDVRWSSEDQDAGYATLVPTKHRESPTAIVASAKFIIAVDLHSGKEKWRYRWLTTFGANAADPIVVGDQIFMSSGYNRGAVLLKETRGEPEVIWKNKEMRTQLNACVLVGDHLYGFDGNTDSAAALKCMEWATGEVSWEVDDLGFGALMVADEHLVLLSDKGELIVAPASPDGFKPTGRLQVLDETCWTVPVLADGLVYCRNSAGSVACVDLRQEKR